MFPYFPCKHCRVIMLVFCYCFYHWNYSINIRWIWSKSAEYNYNQGSRNRQILDCSILLGPRPTSFGLWIPNFEYFSYHFYTFWCCYFWFWTSNDSRIDRSCLFISKNIFYFRQKSFFFDEPGQNFWNASMWNSQFSWNITWPDSIFWHSDDF